MRSCDDSNLRPPPFRNFGNVHTIFITTHSVLRNLTNSCVPLWPLGGYIGKKHVFFITELLFVGCHHLMSVCVVSPDVTVGRDSCPQGCVRGLLLTHHITLSIITLSVITTTTTSIISCMQCSSQCNPLSRAVPHSSIPRKCEATLRSRGATNASTLMHR